VPIIRALAGRAKDPAVRKAAAEAVETLTRESVLPGTPRAKSGAWEVHTDWPFDEAEARRRQRATAEALGVTVERDVDLGDGVKMAMVLIPAGRFNIGSPPGEEGEAGQDDRKRVTIGQPFWLGKCEVTQEQWEAVMANNPSQLKGAKRPVDNVSWHDCQAFLQKLSARAARTGAAVPPFRLPTEAEWEYACRAGAATAYHWGGSSDALADHAWWSGNSSRSAQQVGRRKPNAWGLHDMAGNVWEWCASPYAETYDGSEQKGAEAQGAHRVLRGGSWFSVDPESFQCASRLHRAPATRALDYGLRVARSVAE